MENTTCGKDCPFVKQGFCNSDCECPHYVESVWVQGDTQEKKIVKDCSPKRMLIQNNAQDYKILKLQKAIEEQRNMFVTMGQNFQLLMKELQTLIAEHRQHSNLKELSDEVKKSLPEYKQDVDIEK